MVTSPHGQEMSTFLMSADMVDVMPTGTRLVEGNLVELQVNTFLTITTKLLALRL